MSNRVDTVGELIEALQIYDSDRLVRVNDSGRQVRPNVELVDGKVDL